MLKNLCLIAALMSFIPNLSNAQEKENAVANPVVVLETTQGNVEIKLYPEFAPKTCENFIGLVKKGYYNGLIFHRVIKNFMIQGGDPTGTGMGGESLWGGKFDDEFSNKIRFDRKGLLAMANAGPGTNGSQFFITTVPTPWLNDHHTIFGEVTGGYDAVQKIEDTKVGGQDRPLQEQKIIKAYVK
jgi:peptidylprolyl isomerase